MNGEEAWEFKLFLSSPTRTYDVYLHLSFFYPSSVQLACHLVASQTSKENFFPSRPPMVLFRILLSVCTQDVIPAKIRTRRYDWWQYWNCKQGPFRFPLTETRKTYRRILWSDKTVAFFLQAFSELERKRGGNSKLEEVPVKTLSSVRGTSYRTPSAFLEFSLKKKKKFSFLSSTLDEMAAAA